MYMYIHVQYMCIYSVHVYTCMYMYVHVWEWAWQLSTRFDWWWALIEWAASCDIAFWSVCIYVHVCMRVAIATTVSVSTPSTYLEKLVSAFHHSQPATRGCSCERILSTRVTEKAGCAHTHTRVHKSLLKYQRLRNTRGDKKPRTQVRFDWLKDWKLVTISYKVNIRDTHRPGQL